MAHLCITPLFGAAVPKSMSEEKVVVSRRVTSRIRENLRPRVDSAWPSENRAAPWHNHRSVDSWFPIGKSVVSGRCLSRGFRDLPASNRRVVVFRVTCTAACGRRPHLGAESCFPFLSDFGIGRTPSATKFIRIQSQGALVLLARCVGSLPRGSPRASVPSRLFFVLLFFSSRAPRVLCADDSCVNMFLGGHETERARGDASSGTTLSFGSFFAHFLFALFFFGREGTA